MGSSLARGTNIKTGGNDSSVSPLLSKKTVHNAVLLPCPLNFRFCTKILSSASATYQHSLCFSASWQLSVWAQVPGFGLMHLNGGTQFGLFCGRALFTFTKAILWGVGKLKGFSEQFHEQHANMPATGKQ